MSIRQLSRSLKARPGLLPLVGALAVWTLLWAVLGIEDILTETALGAGRAGSSVETHEILQALFVAAYAGIRWAAGMVFLLGGGWIVWRGMRGGPRTTR